MANKIVWSSRAKFELFEIFDYWNNRNKSNAFNIKLNALIQEQLNLIQDFSKTGKKTDIPNVYVKTVQNYLLYYEFVNDSLYVLSIRHGRRNPKTLNL